MARNKSGFQDDQFW